MRKIDNIIQQVALSFIAIVAACVLSLSTVARYHHHDNNGAVHYSLVCSHGFDDCFHECVNSICAHGHSQIPENDDECALHLDSYYFYNQDDNRNHGHSNGDICDCMLWMALFDDVSINEPEGSVGTCFKLRRIVLLNIDLVANAMRGPPIYG